LSPILFENGRDPLTIARDYFARAVSRTIVDNDDLYLVIGLLKGAVDGGPKEAGVVVVVNKNADEWPREPPTINGKG
jgi:hypothetical protein